MNDMSELPRVTINLIRGCLVATIQLDLDRLVLERFRKDLLARLDASRSRQVILDCSGVEVLDAEDFIALRRTIAMAGLMGAHTMLTGLQPGVVSALVDLEVDLRGLDTAQNLDEAFRLLESRAEPVAAVATSEQGDELADVEPQ
jgi:rsbT antagonist protein RsbS